MKKYTLKTTKRRMLGDTLTPVSIYLRLRDRFPNSLLLESSDYHGEDHSYSYICCNPIASFEVEDGHIQARYPDQLTTESEVKDKHSIVNALNDFVGRFEVEKQDVPFITDGVFGYTAYDAVKYFEDVEIKNYPDESRKIPDMVYNVYQYVIVFSHFKDELFIYCHDCENHKGDVNTIAAILERLDFPTFNFQCGDDEVSNYTDEEFAEIVKKGIAHCQRGDVFQIVLSRRFERSFKGDEFNVYRSLRSINPSPYLFYFDYGDFKIMGSSPEAQLIVKDNKATIHPIAGTFKRTGNDLHDYQLAKELAADPKENAEHVMLVDLARNDLSRNGHHVEVETYRETQYFSHVIHLVSKVTGQIGEHSSMTQLMADTFPAGTLSGAPKPMAMKLINRYETSNRGFYGGAIGHIGFDGSFNHAIMIRSALSKNNRLYYQAGAGVVVKSVVENEVNEVNNKLMAVKKAIEAANDM